MHSSFRMRRSRKVVREKRVRVLLFSVGFSLVIFPVVSQTLYFMASHVIVNTFDKGTRNLGTSEIDRRISLAHAYNSSLQKANPQDPFTEIQKAGRAEYARMLEVGEQLGHISIPDLMLNIPIYAGTNESILKKGVGHLERTALPVGGLGTHSVLTAHRGLPTAHLFTDLDRLEKGDIFYITNIKETLAYEVDQIKIVEPTDLDAVALVGGADYVTLMTCTPYMINSHRLLVRGHRVPYTIREKDKDFKGRDTSFLWSAYVGLFLLVCFFLFFCWKYGKSKIERYEKKLE